MTTDAGPRTGRPAVAGPARVPADPAERCVRCGFEGTGEHACEREWRAALDGRFQLERCLGRRPGSVTFQARPVGGGSPLVLKVIARPDGEDAEAAFQRVISSLDSLNHPNIAAIIDHGISDSFFWYATEFAPGKPLDERRGRVRFDLATCSRMVVQVASALDHAHRRHVVHGALTPANILIDDQGWVRVTDFAIRAALVDAGVLPPSARDARYLAPEQAGPRRVVGAPADQWALAVIAYECLSGSPPFGSRSAATMGQGARPGQLGTHPDNVLPPHVDAAFGRALDARPGLRFDGIQQFAAALDGGAPPAAPPTWPGAAHPGPGLGHLPPAALVPEPPARQRGPGVVVLAAALGLLVSGWWLWVNHQASRATELNLRPPALAIPQERTRPLPPSQPLGALRTEKRLAAEIAPTPSTGSSPQPPVRSVDSLRPATAPAPTPAEPRPAPRPTAPPVRRPPPPEGGPAAPAGVAVLFVNSRPWAQVFVDGTRLGNTPLTGVTIPAGQHRIRIERNGFEPYDQIISVGAGDELRLTGIILRELP